MRVGIIQSNYLPWRGYFDFIASVDLFILHDDLQFTKGDWRNRNRLKTPQGARWFTVPVHYRHTAQRIDETAIDYARDWRREHRHLLRASLGAAPYFDDVRALVEPVFETRPETISQLNAALIRAVCGYLDIRTPLRWSSEFAPRGSRTDRLVGLLSAVGATTYVSGPSARGYLEPEKLQAAGIALEYKGYDYDPYPQLWGPFESAVSIADTIANLGPAAGAAMRGRAPERAVA